MLDRYDNIEEQRDWNREDLWEYAKGGDEWSEKFGTTENLWLNYIYPEIKNFKNKDILEIAPGYGRITTYLLNIAKDLSIIDLNENCIFSCQKRFGNNIKDYYINDGKSLSAIPDNSMDLVFSYDSFVHMHINVVEDYIIEISRVLRPGGHGWLHHSLLIGGEEESFNNIAGRANLVNSEFLEILNKNGFEVINQKLHNTGVIDDGIIYFKLI